jgi:phosphatidate cytidylyltransferase
LSELNKRIAVAIVGIPLAIGLIYIGGYFFSLAIIIIAILGIGEYLKISEQKSTNIQKFSTYFLAISILLLFAFVFKPDLVAFYLLIILITGFLLIYTIQLFKGVQGAVFAVSSVINIVVYLGFGFSSFIIIRNFNKYLLYWRDVFGQNSFFYTSEFAESAIWGLFLLFIFLSIWTCDSAAYFIGKSFGKHKLHPEVSPKKSWEGAIAGLVGAIIAFTLLNYFFISQIPLYFSVIGGLLIGTTGQIGDLAESQLKRDAGIKDSSNLLPGHGGILDRFDSAVFVFPVMVIYLFITAYFW